MFSTKFPWIVLLAVWMVGSTWWHVCKIKQLCADAPPSATPAPTQAAAYSLTDGDRFRLALPSTFNFARSGAVPNLSGFEASLDSVATYLQNNPDRQLTLTGYYTASETNTTSFPNLGIARAESLKALLIQRGVVESAVLTTGVERADLTFNAKGDSVNAGVNGSFGAMIAPIAKPDSAVAASAVSGTLSSATATEAPTPSVSVSATTPMSEENLAKAQKYESIFKPIDLYFKSGSSDYIRTTETKKFFKEAIQYLRKHKDKELVLTGYTDSEGSEDVNLQLSKKRANAVKQRLLSQGVASSQVKAGGKGEADPKASNDTENGRKANRRVTVVVE